MANRTLPLWAEEIRATYLRGESSVFIVHGNVYDHILHEGKLTPLVEFLATVLLKQKDTICQYNLASGAKFWKREPKAQIETLIGNKEPAEALKALETVLLTHNKVALIIDYAETLAPAGETSFQTESDRQSVIRLHRWSLDRRLDNADNLILLVSELLPELNSKLVSNPKIKTIRVPLPDEEARLELVKLLEPDADPRSRDKLVTLSAGLKNVQLRGILAPGQDAEEDVAERRTHILRLLGDVPNARDRAEKLARIFVGQTKEEIAALLKPGGVVAETEEHGRYDDVYTLLSKRKRELIERECFGLIEFVEPKHDLSDVGGMEGVKRELMNIARNIHEGNVGRVPMGMLFTGPMGSGKTYVAEAFAKSSGLTAIKLKNFRSKWVGSTEGNLEKILQLVQSIGHIMVIIDEGDRAFGNTDGEGDGGTSSRVIARIKEFMSDTSNRGRVLFVLMTNRPDKLDIDIKRAGRLDRKIPFFYAEEPEEIERVLKAQLRRHKIEHSLEFPRDRAQTSERLTGYSNADLEAVLLLAHDIAHQEGSKVTSEILDRAIRDYLPARDLVTLEYMELLAVFESSSRAMLPKRYAEVGVAELQERLMRLKARMTLG